MRPVVPPAEATMRGAAPAVLPTVPGPVLARARRAVLDLRQDPRRACFDTLVHVADATRTVTRPLPDRADLGLRTDLVTALLGRLDRGVPLGERDGTPVLASWLSRPGGLDAHDADFAWALAARQAAAAIEADVEFFVVTRRGWRHPESGSEREWARLRRASTRPAGAQSQV